MRLHCYHRMKLRLLMDKKNWHSKLRTLISRGKSLNRCRMLMPQRKQRQKHMLAVDVDPEAATVVERAGEEAVDAVEAVVVEVEEVVAAVVNLIERNHPHQNRLYSLRSYTT